MGERGHGGRKGGERSGVDEKGRVSLHKHLWLS